MAPFLLVDVDNAPVTVILYPALNMIRLLLITYRRVCLRVTDIVNYVIPREAYLELIINLPVNVCFIGST